jgi:hypothetical protein
MCQLYDAYARLVALVQKQSAEAGAPIVSISFHLLWIRMEVRLGGQGHVQPSELPPTANIFITFGAEKTLKVEAAPPWREAASPQSAAVQKWLSPAMEPLSDVANSEGGMRALHEALSLALPGLPILASAGAADLTYRAIDACTGVLYSPETYGVEVRFARNGLVLLRDATMSPECLEAVRMASETGGRLRFLAKLEPVPFLPAFLSYFVKNSGAMAQTREGGIAVLDLEATRNLINIHSPPGKPGSLSRYLGCLRSRLGLFRAARYWQQLCTVSTYDVSNAELSTSKWG